jgi:hypothetical protein
MLAIAFALLAAAPSVPEEALFVRDHPVLGRLVRWGDGWVVTADRAYVVPVTGNELRPVAHPALDRVLEVAESSPTLRVLFGTKGREAKLLSVGASQGATELGLPDAATKGATNWRLAVSGSRVVLVDGRVLFSCELPKCRWSKVDFKQQLWRRRGEPDEPKAVAVLENEVLIAVDSGEWGGGLWSIDTRRGKVSLVENDSEPATGVTVDRAGRVWATWGQSHMIAAQGTLRVRENGKWKVVARSDNLEPHRHRNWPLEPTSFESVTVVGGRVFVLTSALGVVEMANGWSIRTMGWPGHQYVTALELSGDTAVIVTFDGGVVLWNLRTGQKSVARQKAAP